MRDKLFLLFMLISFSWFNVKAQDKKIKFGSINFAGLVMGESSTDLVLQTVNGIAYNNLYSGIGFGIDYYNYNSYPLFFDQRVYFGRDKKAFGYGDLGYNFNAKNKPGKEIYYYGSYHFSGGVYTDFGVGYKMKFIKKSFFTISCGFSYKEIKDKIGTINPLVDCASGVACPLVDYSNYKYGNGRVILKAGIDF